MKIFVTLGSSNQNFNRLLKKIDELEKNNIIDEMNIKIIIKTFVKLKAIFNLLIAIINIIIA